MRIMWSHRDPAFRKSGACAPCPLAAAPLLPLRCSPAAAGGWCTICGRRGAEGCLAAGPGACVC